MVTIEIKIVMSTSHVNYHYALIRVTMCKQPLCLDLSAWLRGCGWVGGGGDGKGRAISLFSPTRPFPRVEPSRKSYPFAVKWYGTWQIEISDNTTCFLVLEHWIKKDTKFWK